MNLRSIRTLAALSAVVGAALAPRPAQACGGLFCSQAAAVNQSAERIIFSNDGNGTVTAVIQIMYQGPSENFSWLLPIPAVPDAEGEIAVASDLAFQRLQAATNPQYNLTTVVEGDCRVSPSTALPGDAVADSAAGPSGAGNDLGSGGVSVAASGVVGNFEWTALALDPALEDPAAAAIQWLTDNGYDVLPQTSALIGPYLESGLYLLALKLTKGSSTGAIRPIVLSYPGDLPSIPIKLTAVAANDDMGVMTWMLSGARAVPFNYADLELNEARINWFSAGANYDAVVTAAADDAGGQGFVTEFAASTGALADVVWSRFEEQQWNQIQSLAGVDPEVLFNETMASYAGYDGFWEVVRSNVQLPDGVTIEDLQNCPFCYQDAELNPQQYLNALEAGVIEPMRLVQRLIDQQPYVTRLYSTLSAAEMTVDPVFTYNRDLRDVSNIHSARRIIECEPHLYQWEANWRIELPQGGTLRGRPSDVGAWPASVDAQPANVRIRTLSESGPGRVMQDNSSVIAAMLQQHNAGVPEATGSPLPEMPTNGGVGMSSGRIYSGSRGCALTAASSGGASALAPSVGLPLLCGLLLARRRRRA